MSGFPGRSSCMLTCRTSNALVECDVNPPKVARCSKRLERVLSLRIMRATIDWNSFAANSPLGQGPETLVTSTQLSSPMGWNHAVIDSFLLPGGIASCLRNFRTDFLEEWPTPGTGPHFDTSMQSNFTGLVGKTVHLVCKVKNLGNRTVSHWKNPSSGS